jgi:hypothetical protein
MKPIDDAIREAFRGLRQASVPPVPEIRPAPPVPRRVPLVPLGAAAAMLAGLAAMLFPLPSRPLPAAAAVAHRLDAVEAKLPRVEHEELRRLLAREVELLRLELRLAAETP